MGTLKIDWKRAVEKTLCGAMMVSAVMFTASTTAHYTCLGASDMVHPDISKAICGFSGTPVPELSVK